MTYAEIIARTAALGNETCGDASSLEPDLPPDRDPYSSPASRLSVPYEHTFDGVTIARWEGLDFVLDIDPAAASRAATPDWPPRTRRFPLIRRVPTSPAASSSRASSPCPARMRSGESLRMLRARSPSSPSRNGGGGGGGGSRSASGGTSITVPFLDEEEEEDADDEGGDGSVDGGSHVRLAREAAMVRRRPRVLAGRCELQRGASSRASIHEAFVGYLEERGDGGEDAGALPTFAVELTPPGAEAGLSGDDEDKWVDEETAPRCGGGRTATM